MTRVEDQEDRQRKEDIHLITNDFWDILYQNLGVGIRVIIRTVPGLSDRSLREVRESESPVGECVLYLL